MDPYNWTWIRRKFRTTALPQFLYNVALAHPYGLAFYLARTEGNMQGKHEEKRASAIKDQKAVSQVSSRPSWPDMS